MIDPKMRGHIAKARSSSSFNHVMDMFDQIDVIKKANQARQASPQPTMKLEINFNDLS
jgi:hypothetical protein